MEFAEARCSSKDIQAYLLAGALSGSERKNLHGCRTFGADLRIISVVAGDLHAANAR